MQSHLSAFLPTIAPILFFLLAAFLLVRNGKGLAQSKAAAQLIAWVGVISSISAILMLAWNGPVETPFMEFRGLGPSIRVDALSITMLTMISVLGLVIIRFTRNYMDGDSREWVFLTRMVTTIASVELLVLSGNMMQLSLFWIVTSICLHHLLLFYPHRPKAISAARKKFIVARLGDACILAATMLIYLTAGTGNLTEIFADIREAGPLSANYEWSAVLLVAAAVLKSAQFPTHGWLIEVVETPTPVSALLHAGLLNAGPFLVVRMSHLIGASVSASLILIAIAGFTALFASVVFLTQPSIKVALGYSSIAHMGFSLLMSGFGIYSASLLHLVAHSFYKAHSFLSSGSVVERAALKQVRLPDRERNPWKIALGFGLAAGIYALFCVWWGIDPTREFNLFATGAIIVLGISRIMVPALDSKSGWTTIGKSVVLAFLVSCAFFSLEYLADQLLVSQIPMAGPQSTSILLATCLVLIGFTAVIGLQSFFSRPKPDSLGYRLGIHLRNGLYTNILFDRMVGSLQSVSKGWLGSPAKPHGSQGERAPGEGIEMEWEQQESY